MVTKPCSPKLTFNPPTLTRKCDVSVSIFSGIEVCSSWIYPWPSFLLSSRLIGFLPIRLKVYFSGSTDLLSLKSTLCCSHTHTHTHTHMHTHNPAPQLTAQFMRFLSLIFFSLICFSSLNTLCSSLRTYQFTCMVNLASNFNLNSINTSWIFWKVNLKHPQQPMVEHCANDDPCP